MPPPTATKPAPTHLSLEKTWQGVLEKCRQVLDDQDDYEMIVGFQHHEQIVSYLRDMVNNYEKGSIARRIHRFSLHVPTLQAFITTLFVGLGAANLSAACFFGSILLLLKLASESDQAFTAIINILDELTDRLKLFDIYNQSLELDPETLQVFFDILVELIISIVTAIKHFRRNRISDAILPTNSNWGILTKRFTTDLQRLQSRLDQLQRLLEAKNSAHWTSSQAELIRRLEQFSMQPQPPPAPMRCNTIPYPPHPGFFGREDILADIAEAFDRQGPRLNSVAIWGTGGVGKTQIALEFANRRWLKGFDVILWIGSETPAEVAKAFNDAAQGLGLDSESEHNSPEKNRHMVLQWIQKTETPWLLVFDNVENHEALLENWPSVGHGCILVTCRSELLANSDTIATPIEVPPFSPAQSTDMILHILNKKSVSEEEASAVSELSNKLGGLALAIDIIAKHIKSSRRFKSVAEFLPYFEKNKRSVFKRPKRGGRDAWYSKDVETVWQTAFGSLSDDAAQLLGILSCMGPEAIPQFLFESEGRNERRLIEECELLTDIDRLEEAKMELLDLSLIRINTDIGIISVHRVLQTVFFSQMPLGLQVASFHHAHGVLRSHFPQPGPSHLYTEWKVCNDLHHHVLALRDRYEILKLDDAFPANNTSYIDLIRDDAWYMIEIQHFLEAERSLHLILENIEPDSLGAAKIQRSLLGLYERMGRSVKACEAAKAELAIMLKHDVPKDNELANGYSNVGYALVSAFRSAEGIPYLDEAIALARSVPEPQSYQDYNLDRFLRNRGRGKAQLGAFAGALLDFDEAERIQTKIHGLNSHYHGETKHERSKIAALQGKLDEAYQLSKEAHDLVSVGKPTHASVMATQYRMGCIAMLQGDHDTALEHLKRALVICQLNEPQRGNAGESSRVRWRMAELYENVGNLGDAQILRNSALATKKDLLVGGEYAVVEDADGSWDALVGLLYR